MKLYDIIRRAETMRPGNDWDSELVIEWIREVDAIIQMRACLRPMSLIVPLIPDEYVEGNAYADCMLVSKEIGGEWHKFIIKNGELCEIPLETYVVHPYDKLYVEYIIAMMDYVNQEYDKYANDYAVYNATVEDFAKWWQKTYRNDYEVTNDEYYTTGHPYLY